MHNVEAQACPLEEWVSFFTQIGKTEMSRFGSKFRITVLDVLSLRCLLDIPVDVK